MAEPKKFDPETILTSRDLPAVFSSIHEMANEFAVLGQISTAKSLISLLLSHYSSDWQLWQIRPLTFAFAEADQWPEQIPQEDRTEEALNAFAASIASNLGDESDAEEDDPAELGVLLQTAKNRDASTGSQAVERSGALAAALAIAVRLASKHSSSIKEIEADPKVQKTLGYIATGMGANQAINRLMAHRTNWRLLATGALARKIPVDKAKLEALGQEVIATVTERFKNGRQTHPRETMSIRELLEQLDRNTKENSTSHFDEMEEEPPASLFVMPPATDEQISALERRLDARFPDDYKEFLKISNGFGGSWNGYYLDPPLHGVDDVEWSEIYSDELPVELHEGPSGIIDLELPDGREWPTQESPVEIGSFDVLQAMFIPPHVTKKAIKAYNETMESPHTPDDLKQQTRELIASKYGSWEAFEKLEWVAVEHHDTESVICGSFTQFLQERVSKSEMCYLGESKGNSLAYSCMAETGSE